MQHAKDRSLYPFSNLVLAVLFTLCAVDAVAQVNLQNTIKKVETFINPDGLVERRMVDAIKVVPGDELQYTVRFSNDGEAAVDAGSIVITDAIPAHTQYVDGSAFGSGTDVRFSVDGESFAPPKNLMLIKQGAQVIASAENYTAIRWTFAPVLKPGASGYVSFKVRLK